MLNRTATLLSILILALVTSCGHLSQNTRDNLTELCTALQTSSQATTPTLRLHGRVILSNSSKRQDSFSLISELNTDQVTFEIWLVSDLGTLAYHYRYSGATGPGDTLNHTSFKTRDLNQQLALPLFKTLILNTVRNRDTPTDNLLSSVRESDQDELEIEFPYPAALVQAKAFESLASGDKFPTRLKISGRHPIFEAELILLEINQN